MTNSPIPAFSRTWEDIASELITETNNERVSELAKELTAALDRKDPISKPSGDNKV